MVNIVIFSQNVKLSSLERLKNKMVTAEENVFLTSHMLYDNEKEYICSIFENCTFLKFADLLSDKEMEKCDFEVYKDSYKTVFEYYTAIKKRKNELIYSKLKEKYSEFRGILCTEDLGIGGDVWKKQGFKFIKCEYYYNPYNAKTTVKETLKKFKPLYSVYRAMRRNACVWAEDVYVSEFEGKKLVFVGSLNRIGYRMDLQWIKSDSERNNLVNGQFEPKEICQYLSTLHECSKMYIPDDEMYDVRLIQDGYLPPNYSSKYLLFKPKNAKYYAWDVMGEETFKMFDIPVSIMPFRKKLYLPEMEFHKKVKTILVATSGPGDWTAQKNRSDEDLMLTAFVEIARRFPDIEIIYRCHPTWIHPEHNGVNSINRAAEYIVYSGLKNIHLSSNIPQEQLNSFVLSFPRSSLKDDLDKADLVFGEHSVSMLDGAFEKIPFASVNLTNRRNLACGLTDLGFPHCESIDDIAKVIENYETKDFQDKFNQAVNNYNQMTDME